MSRQRDRLRRRNMLLLAATLAFAAGLVALHVRAYRLVSPMDELQHIDYVLKISDGELVRRGDHFGTAAMREESCRGLDYSYEIPACDQPELRPEQYQESGYNTAFIHPPTYYVISGLGGRIAAAVLPGGLITWARLFGALWLVGAVVLMWLAMAELVVPVAARVIVTTLMVTAPTVLLSAAIVNNDATSVFCGAAVLLAVLRWERGRGWMWPAVAAAFTVLTKSTNATVLAIAVFYVAIRIFQQRRLERAAATVDDRLDGRFRSFRDPVVLVVAMGVAVLVAGVAWLGVMSRIARVPADDIPMVQRARVSSISLSQVISNVPAGETPLQTPYIPPIVKTESMTIAARLVNDLALAAVVAAALGAAAASNSVRALGVATMAAMFAVGPVFVVFNFVVQKTYTPIPARYGLALVPVIAVAAAGVLRSRAAIWVAGCFASAVAGATVFALLTA